MNKTRGFQISAFIYNIFPLFLLIGWVVFLDTFLSPILFSTVTSCLCQIEITKKVHCLFCRYCSCNELGVYCKQKPVLLSSTDLFSSSSSKATCDIAIIKGILWSYDPMIKCWRQCIYKLFVTWAIQICDLKIYLHV